MTRIEIFQKVYGNDHVFTIQEMERLCQLTELIVWECLSHGKLTQSQTVINASDEYNAGREMGIEVFMNQIKQHFGVQPNE